MSDQAWDVLEFVERFRNGEYDGQWGETLDSLSPEQIEDLHRLLMQGECRKSDRAERSEAA
jgi:hypothetical protein